MLEPWFGTRVNTNRKIDFYCWPKSRIEDWGADAQHRDAQERTAEDWGADVQHRDAQERTAECVEEATNC